jgi:hypothetical protein
MRYEPPLDDELEPFDQDIVGRVVRLHIPLKSPSAMLQVADMLRGLANQCELAATGSGNPRTRMFELMMYARQVDRRLKTVKGRGRPPKLIR